MPVKISRLAEVDPRAELDENVEIGPFCVVGPHVTIGAGTRFDSHVSITGHTSIGRGNRFFPNSVIGGEPQDLGYRDSERTESSNVMDILETTQVKETGSLAWAGTRVRLSKTGDSVSISKLEGDARAVEIGILPSEEIIKTIRPENA